MSAVYGFIVIFTLLMAGIGAALTMMDAQASVWNAQDRARQIVSSQQAEHLVLSLNGTSLTVRNVGLIPSQLLYLYQKGVTSSTDRRIGSSLPEGTNMTLQIAAAMSGFAVITALGNIFWAYNSTQSPPQTQTVPITFDAAGIDPSLGSVTVLAVDGLSYAYSSLPKTFEWTAGSSHTYSYTEGISAGSGSRVGWTSARGISSTISGTVKATQSGSIISAYTQQYLLTVSGGGGVQYVGSPSGDGWFDAGSSAQVTTTLAWNLSAGQSRQSLVSWNLDGGTDQAVTRSGSGTYTTAQIIMNTFHAVNFNSVTQYHVSTQTSVPSGSLPSISTGYSYNQVTTTTYGPYSGSLTARHDSGCDCYDGVFFVVNPPSGTLLSTSVSGSVESTDGVSGDGAIVGASSGNPSCWAFTSGSGYNSLASTASGGACPPGSAYAYVCPNSCSAPDTVYYSNLMVSFQVSNPTSSSSAGAGNSYSVSGTTVTYSYGVGYGFPSGATSTSWSATWPSAESYGSDNCPGASVSGNVISSSASGTCTLYTMRSGSYSSSLGPSPTGDGWYDSGSSVSISSSVAGPFVFSSWSSTNTALLAVASATSPSALVQVGTYGTITANLGVSQ